MYRRAFTLISFIICALLLSSSLTYTRIVPRDLSSLLAYATLFPHTVEGKRALCQAWELVQGKGPIPDSFKTLFRLTPPLFFQPTPTIHPDESALLDQLAAFFPNRTLQGYRVSSLEELLSIPPEQIDVGHALLLLQTPERVKNYEGILDWMALQAWVELVPEGGLNAPAEKKIEVINRLIFQKMHLSFPPQETYSAAIDQYTFLSSVLDERRGVCLGTTLLYLCLAQRLNLPLQIITPPGHILIYFEEGDKQIVIETTARGANVPLEYYLNVNTHTLQKRNFKELLGLVYINEASVAAQQSEREKALDSYQKAALFLPEDPLLWQLTSFQLLLMGKEKEGKELLQNALNAPSPFSISKESIMEDLLTEQVNHEGIDLLILPTEHTEEGIRKKQETIQALLNRFPNFREGWMQLAMSWIELQRPAEAIQALETLASLDPNHPEVHYYLTLLFLERFDLLKAQQHLSTLKQLLNEAHHTPPLLTELEMNETWLLANPFASLP